ncbi:MAG TPA: hypothetical protein DD416_01590 [Rhodobacteraceae bacterium]|jgi:hypothetical protein|nr:hypothetical protein [Rhodobacter sp.]HBN29930.1 hypothetical protein [Paracoccaceae bacterium]
MKNFLLISMAISLSGCLPTGWYNASVTQSRANGDLTNCQVRAVNDVPTNIQTQTTGGYFIGYIYIPTQGSVDVNTTLREKVVAQCMTKRGYQTIELPLCPARVAIPDMNRPVILTEKSCFKDISGGYYAIALK